MINSLKKGHSGEREFCLWLKKNLNLEETPLRNLSQTRDGGYDIYLEPFMFEIKRVEKLNKSAWWKQVKKASKLIENSIPVVAYRQNRKSWNFLIGSRYLGLHGGFIQLREEIFVNWIRLKFMEFNEKSS